VYDKEGQHPLPHSPVYQSSEGTETLKKPLSKAPALGFEVREKRPEFSAN
jgi:hypothetical protein